MSKTSFTRKRGRPVSISAEEHARLAALTDEQVNAAAATDADNPPIGDAELRRMSAAREVRRVREKLGLTQSDFAARYHLGLSRLRDWEQGRFAPDFIAMAYLQLISDHPTLVDELVARIDGDHLAV